MAFEHKTEGRRELALWISSKKNGTGRKAQFILRGDLAWYVGGTARNPVAGTE